jgi:hypothetical protein
LLHAVHAILLIVHSILLQPACMQDTVLKVYPELEEPSLMMDEYMVLRALDQKNVTVISSVMAQTVAMDYYSANVDEVS